MRFFEQQRVAKKNSFYLLILFTLAVLAIGFITAGTVSAVIVLQTSNNGGLLIQESFWKIFKIIFFFISGIIFLVSFIRILFPTSGASIASSLGGQLVDKGTIDPHEKKLLNIVEEMSIASGVPIPPVYILIHDNTINAFAAGTDVFNAVIAVTKGAITVLTRDELQGVVGHEFSHIFHDDLQTNLRITATISGLMAIANLGRFLMQMNDSGRSTFKNRRNEKQSAFVGLALFVIGSLGVFFSRMIQSAISRQREYLADASATQFTRNPLALASALAKIHYLSGSAISSARNYEMDHYFFASAISKGLFSSFFATHPPIENRIKEIYPSFDHKDFLFKLNGKTEVQEYFQNLELHRQKYCSTSMNEKPITDEKKVVFESIANPTAVHLGFAKQVIVNIPDEINNAAQSVFGAMNVIWSVLLSYQENSTTQKFLSEYITNLSDKKEIQYYISYLQSNFHTRAALLSLSLASLSVLPLYERRKIRNQVQSLFLLDGDFSFLEMMQFIYFISILLIEEPGQKEILNGKNKAKSFEKIIAWFIAVKPSYKDDINLQKTQYIRTISNFTVSARPFESIEKLTLEDLTITIGILKNLTLSEKGKLLNSLFKLTDVKNLQETESLRFICGILKVPVPPILVDSRSVL